MILFTAAAPPGGGRAVLTHRFVRHFNVLSLPENTESTLHCIFHSIFSGFLKKFDPDIRKVIGFRPCRDYTCDLVGIVVHDTSQLSETTVKATIDVYRRSCAELLPTPSKFHYTFNMRDVAKVYWRSCECGEAWPINYWLLRAGVPRTVGRHSPQVQPSRRTCSAMGT